MGDRLKNLVFVDTHAHLDFAQFHRQHQAVIERAKKAAVFKIINIGSTLSGSQDSVKLAAKYREVYASVGIHPQEVSNVRGETMKEILELGKSPKIVAIGEIGLDYKDIKNIEIKESQKRFFKIQIGITRQLKLPVIIHSRGAFSDIYEILSTYSQGISGVFHCFSEGKKEAQKVLDLGFFISFAANIAYPKNNSLREVVKAVPLSKLLLETDCPFLPPQSHRGEINEPAFVVETAKEIAKIKGVSLKEVAEATTKNAEELFRI